MICRVAVMQFLRFRIISMLRPTKSSRSQKEEIRELRGVQGQHNPSRVKSLSLPPRQTTLPSLATDLLLSAIPGSKRSIWRSRAFWEILYRLLMVSCRGKWKCHSEPVVVTGKSRAGERQTGRGTHMCLQCALPLTAPFLLAPTYPARNRVQQKY